MTTVQVTVSTTPALKRYLAALVATGLYGKTEAEAAERLIAQGVERALTTGTISRAEPTKTSPH